VDWGGEEPFGVRQLGKCGATPDSKRIMVERIHFDPDEIASVAARYAAYLDAGLPTYLDTLPRLRIALSKKGIPNWVSLLPDDGRFVDGGERWHRWEPVRGLSITLDKSKNFELKVPLHHEDDETVREWTKSLPELRSASVPVQLIVSMEPARGSAVLRVVSDPPELLPYRRLLVDFHLMTDTGKTPGEYLETLPHAFPKHSPRRGSPTYWEGGQIGYNRTVEGGVRAITDFLNHPSRKALRAAVVALRAQDNRYDGFEYRAVDSEGVPAEDRIEDVHLLKEFTDLLVECLDDPGDLEQAWVVRGLAYASSCNPAFLEYLRRAIRNKRHEMSQAELAGCGWCLRDPEDVAAFTGMAFLPHMDRSTERPANWVKALWEILRYRPEATRDISSDDCTTIAQYLMEILERQLRRPPEHKFQHIFKRVSGGIAYLLRRRAHDKQFLDPETELAKKIKVAFRKAIQEVKDHPENVIGGAIRIDHQLQLIVDYIDRKGTGLISIGVDQG